MPQGRYTAQVLGPTMQDYATQVAREEGIRPELVHAVIQQESSWNPAARSPVGAQGLMQLMPPTAAEMKVGNPLDPGENIRGGVRYLKQQLQAFGGDETKALAAYNAGAGRVRRAGGVPNIPETQNYVRRITANAAKGMSAPPPPAQAAQATRTATPPPAPTVPAQTASAPAQATSGRYGPADLGAPDVASLQQPAPMGSTPAATPPPEPQRGFVGEMINAFNPLERVGRRNIAGTLGGAAGAYFSGGLAAIPAAGAAGAAEDAVEQWIEKQAVDLSEAGWAGAEQAGGELLGGVLAWPVKFVGRRVLTPIVNTQVAKRLSSMRMGREAALDTALRQADEVLTKTRFTKTEILDAAQDKARQGVTAAKDQAANRTGAVAARLSMNAPAVRPSEVGKMALGVIEGPAKGFKDQVGEAVEAAAKTGPPIPSAPLKARLAELAEQITPFASHDRLPQIPGFSADQVKQIAAANPSMLSVLPPDHPLPAVLDRVRSAMGDLDAIPYEDAHKIKRLLDDAVNWQSPAKKQVQQITKGFRTTLREAMLGHQPYDDATAAYQSVSRLYGNKGLARQLQRQAIDDPESLVHMVKSKQPTKLQGLKEILLSHSAEGGDAGAGQAAWDALRASWTFENLTKHGPEQLSERIGKLSPEFTETLYGDAAGQSVLGNLKQIGEAYTKAVERGAEEIVSAQTAGRQGVRAAKRAGNVQVLHAKQARQVAAEARQLGKAATPVEQAFKDSRLHRAPTFEQTAADVIRAGALGPTSIWGGLSMIRLLRGVKGKELLQWAAMSPTRTRLLVGLIESPVLPSGAAGAVRASGVTDRDLLMPSHRSSTTDASTPPPMAAPPPQRSGAYR